MKKMKRLLLAFFILGAASTNAQVRIGGHADPDASAILDLNPNTGDATLGLLLPRVALSSTTDVTTIPNPALGLTVYNTSVAGSGATEVVHGIYVYDGAAWILSINTGNVLPVITSQPAKFTFHRLYDEQGDPNGPDPADGTTLTVIASNAATYQWYRKSDNPFAADIEITNANGDSYIFIPGNTGKEHWGLYQFYCVISNVYGSVKSDIAEVVYGCGAKTNDNRWLRFMCHNLGAAFVTSTETLDAITVNSHLTHADADTLSSDAKGWLIQWGRLPDEHRWRSSTLKEGPDDLYGYAENTGITSLEFADYFIGNNDLITAHDWRIPQFDYLWHKWHDDSYPLPCPDGWHIPNPSEWGSIYRSGGQFGTLDEATSNVWKWNNYGALIQPDGATTTLFLPAAGYRYDTGELKLVGEVGAYWSNIPLSSGASALAFSGFANPTMVSPGIPAPSGSGMSIRCIAQ